MMVTIWFISRKKKLTYEAEIGPRVVEIKEDDDETRTPEALQLGKQIESKAITI